MAPLPKSQSEALSQFVLAPEFLRLFEATKGTLFFIKDRNSLLLGGNRLMAEHLGVDDPADLFGKNDYEMLPPDLAAKYREDDREVIKTGRSMENIIELFPNHLGDISWFITTKIPLFDAQGKVAGLCGVCHDHNEARPVTELSPVLEYMNDHLAEKNSNADLAKLVDMSVRHFETKFKNTFGTTPHQYLIKMRVLKSCAMLRLGKSISETAIELGFYDQSAFSTQFRKYMEVTPRSYQQGFH